MKQVKIGTMVYDVPEAKDMMNAINGMKGHKINDVEIITDGTVIGMIRFIMDNDRTIEVYATGMDENGNDITDSTWIEVQEV